MEDSGRMEPAIKFDQQSPVFYPSIQPRFGGPDPSRYGYPIYGYNSPRLETRYHHSPNKWNATPSSQRSKDGNPRDPINHNETLNPTDFTLHNERGELWEHRRRNMTTYDKYKRSNDKINMRSPTNVNHYTRFPCIPQQATSIGNNGTLINPNTANFRHPSESLVRLSTPVQPMASNFATAFRPIYSHCNQQRLTSPLFQPTHYPPPFVPPILMKETPCHGAPTSPELFCSQSQLVPSAMYPVVAQKASMWSIHVSPEGTKYYYNSSTKVSAWEKPLELLEFERMYKIASDSERSSLENDKQTNENIKTKEDVSPKKQHEGQNKPKPIISKVITGSVWCLVGTNDNRIFFYNAHLKSSEWAIPHELRFRTDVNKMVEDMRREIEEICNQPKMDNAIRQSESPLNSICIELQDESEDLNGAKLSTEIDSSRKKSSRRGHLKNKDGVKKSKQEKTETHVEEEETTQTLKAANLQDKLNTTEVSAAKEREKENQSNVEAEVSPKFSSLQDMVSLKGIDIELAEQIAAKERANIPFEERKQRFHDLLKDKNVSAFSTWEKELQKIVFDPRYLLLTSKERKCSFQSYVQERAGEEARENQARLKSAREEFVKLVDNLLDEDDRLEYATFERKHAKDSRMALIEKPIDRKTLFMERLTQRRRTVKKAKIPRSPNAESKRADKSSTTEQTDHILGVKQAKRNFQKFLLRNVTGHHYHWKNICNDFGLRLDCRFLELGIHEMEKIFRSHRQELKRHAKECKDTHDKKRKKSKSSKCHSSSRKRHCHSPSSQHTDTASKKSDGELSSDSD